MNRAQKVWTILCLLLLVLLGVIVIALLADSHDSDKAIPVFIVGLVVLGALYTGMFFILKKDRVS